MVLRYDKGDVLFLASQFGSAMDSEVPEMAALEWAFDMASNLPWKGGTGIVMLNW